MTARMNKQMQFSFHDKGNFKSSVLICFRENSFLGPKNFLLPYMALILCFIPKSQYDTPSGFHPSTVKCHTKRQFCPSPSSSSPSSLLPRPSTCSSAGSPAPWPSPTASHAAASPAHHHPCRCFRAASALPARAAVPTLPSDRSREEERASHRMGAEREREEKGVKSSFHMPFSGSRMENLTECHIGNET